MLVRAALLLTAGVLLGGAQGVDEEAARLAEARAHLDAGRFEEAKEAFERANRGAGKRPGPSSGKTWQSASV